MTEQEYTAKRNEYIKHLDERFPNGWSACLWLDQYPTWEEYVKSKR
jgi:hypothetical protein